jgi:hypothetical protein
MSITTISVALRLLLGDLHRIEVMLTAILRRLPPHAYQPVTIQLDLIAVVQQFATVMELAVLYLGSAIDIVRSLGTFEETPSALYNTAFRLRDRSSRIYRRILTWHVYSTRIRQGASTRPQ